MREIDRQKTTIIRETRSGKDVLLLLFLKILALALFLNTGSAPGLAQGNMFHVERGDGPRGADDSTTGHFGIQAYLSVTPESFHWPNGDKNWKIVTIENNGDFDTGFLQGQFTNGGESFVSFSTCNNTLPTHSVCHIQLRPQALLSGGTHSGTFNISAHPGGDFDIHLTHQVIPASLSASPLLIDWQSNRDTRSIALTNIGGSASGTISATISGGAGYFQILSNNCAALNVGQSCHIQLRPATSVSGTVSAVLHLADLQGGSAAQVQLRAQGGKVCGAWRSWGACNWSYNQLFTILQNPHGSGYPYGLTRDACKARCEADGKRCCMWAVYANTSQGNCVGADLGLSNNLWTQLIASGYGQPWMTYAASCQ